MIDYERTSWYGLVYLKTLRGSLLPACLPAMIFAGLIGGFFACGAVDSGGWPIRDFFGHPYAMQLLGLVFGYLSVARLNVSYERYWEGVSQIKIMHSKWSQACSQLLAFDRVTSVDEDVGTDPFCAAVVRLFCQLSAVATLTLHTDSTVWAEPEVRRASQDAEKSNKAGPLRPAVGDVQKGSLSSKNRRCSSLLKGMRKHEHYLEFFRRDELAWLMKTPDPVLTTAHRISRAITTRQRAGGVSAPSPLVSRVFQELSNGMEAFNSAMKIKEVPVPFAYVQFNALLLLLFQVLTPVAIACFSTPEVEPDDVNRVLAVIVSVFLSMISVGGFTAMWLVANELEDPFGQDANDIDILGYHERFSNSLKTLLGCGWRLEDHWAVPEGVWLNPLVPTVANVVQRVRDDRARDWRRASASALTPLCSPKPATPMHPGDEESFESGDAWSTSCHVAREMKSPGLPGGGPDSDASEEARDRQPMRERAPSCKAVPRSLSPTKTKGPRSCRDRPVRTRQYVNKELKGSAGSGMGAATHADDMQGAQVEKCEVTSCSLPTLDA